MGQDLNFDFHPGNFGAVVKAGLGRRDEGGSLLQSCRVQRTMDQDALTVRRSSRAVKQRYLVIDGHHVLKANNYDMETGEPSVFHSESSRVAAENAFSRRGGRQLGSVMAQFIPREAPKSAPAAGHTRAINPEEKRRQAHNQSIREAAALSTIARSQFLLKHAKVLAPFISNKVILSIRAEAAKHASQAAAARPPTQVSMQPASILGDMRDYQLDGLRFMTSMFDNGMNAILADEMGLGKTLQTISFLAHLHLDRGLAGPSLVVCPLSVISSWMAEFQRWCPSLRVVRIHSSDANERARIRHEVLCQPHTFDVAVTTYDLITSQEIGKALSRNITWRYLVLDEGHKIKNEMTNIAAAMRHIGHQHILLLTGTPMQNNLHELYALLNFMYPDVFTTSEPFDEAFDLTNHKVDRERLEQARKLLQVISIRRLKEDVEKGLPPRVETRVYCPLSQMQTFWYRRLLLKDSSLLKKIEADFQAEGGKVAHDGDWRRLRALWMQLRKCCNHPYLFKDAEPDFDGETTGEDVVEASGKMAVLDRLLLKLKSRGHRVTLFSQFKMQLDLLEDYCILRGFRYLRLDGSTNRVMRMIDMHLFNQTDSPFFVYLLCTRAGGLGINLQSADTCVLYDSDWNPQWDLQAQARVHRLGQKKPVHVYRLCTGGTIEERIQQRAEKKLYLDQMVNRGVLSQEGSDDLEGLGSGEMLSMIKFGADRIFKAAEGAAPSDADLEAILDRSTAIGKSAIKTEATPTKLAGGVMVTRDAPNAVGLGCLAAEQDPTGASMPHVKAEAADGQMSAPAHVNCSLKEEQEAALEEGLAEALLQGSSRHNAKASGQKGLQSAASPARHTRNVTSAQKQPRASPRPSGNLLEGKLNASTFDAQNIPTSCLVLNGIDYTEARCLKDISQDFWGTKDAKRLRKQRLMQIDGHAILRQNAYDLNEGEQSVFGRELNMSRELAQVKKRKLQKPGRDYTWSSNCQACGQGGELALCDQCPCALHPECLGMTLKEVESAKQLKCPHHACIECSRNSSAAGGVLFRCEACTVAYCEDHLPIMSVKIIKESMRFQALGQLHPSAACFIRCSPECEAFCLENPDIFPRRSEDTSIPCASPAACGHRKSPHRACKKVKADVQTSSAEKENAGL
ncbi:hypothetical protein WJX74_004265 [Apatococcus lobatus]|uniref:Uncharacterized protein n=2 Tax=Apatococcus TaxID=904362 RepID=A0AAW1SS63_9CHLO